MDSGDYDRLRLALGMTRKAFAGALGLDIRTARRYEGGKVPIPRYVALACSAVWHRLGPYGDSVGESLVRAAHEAATIARGEGR